MIFIIYDFYYIFLFLDESLSDKEQLNETELRYFGSRSPHCHWSSLNCRRCDRSNRLVGLVGHHPAGHRLDRQLRVVQLIGHQYLPHQQKIKKAKHE